MQDNFAVNLLERMLKVYSPSGKESEVANLIKDEMKKLGFKKVRFDIAGNIYGEMGNGSPTILLCGHMDTIPGKIPVRFNNGKLYGRGAVDAKSSLAAMIIATKRAFSNSQELPKGRVIVAGVVDEEGRSTGIRQLVNENLNVDYAIFGEPSGLCNITFAYKGRIKLRIKCSTTGGHIGAQHLYRNAIEAAFNFWKNLQERFEKEASPHGIFYSPTSVLTGIRSSRKEYNITPESCALDIDVRLPPKLKSKEAIKIIEETIKNYERLVPKISIDLKVLDIVEPFVANRKSILMNALSKAIKDVMGIQPTFLRKTGTGDMNLYGRIKKMPVATYGPGNSRLSHTKNEYIEIKDYLKAIRIYEKTIVYLFNKK